jgi:DNA-binding transcriptional ArsR family regulator
MSDSASTFEAFIAAERERLSGERAALWDRQKEIEDRLAAIEKEMDAIRAYEAVKSGKPVPAAAASAAPGEPKPGGAAGRRARAPRGAGGGVRQQVLETIRGREGGATAADLYAFLEADDKAAQQAVNNALAALKKAGAVRQERRKGPYTATESPAEDQGEAG